MRTSIVYLLHFSKPFSHARHYLGSTNNLEQRFSDHINGQGATLTREASLAGIKMSIVRTWDGDRTFERQLKNQKQGPRLCPICNPNVKEHLYESTIG